MIKYKIMYIVSTLKKAGPTNQLLYLIKDLDKNTFDPIVVTLSPEPADSSYKLFKALNIKVESLNCSRIKGFIFAKVRLNNLISKYKPNIIQTHGIRADRVIIKHWIPRIITLRTSLKQALPMQVKPIFLGKLIADLLYRYHLLYMKKRELVIVCSKSLSEELYRLGKVKSIYIQNGVDTYRYNIISEKLKKRLRDGLNFPVNKKIFISVGSLIPEKNVGLIIKLFMRWEFLKDTILIILGTGAEFTKYKKIVKDCGNIKLLGDKHDVSKYLQIADYFISASNGEGLPNAVLEAMSTGTPCVLTDISPHREILGKSRLGVIFKNNDNKDLKNKVMQIMNMDYDYLSQACRDHILKYFSATRMSLDYQRLYMKILNN